MKVVLKCLVVAEVILLAILYLILGITSKVNTSSKRNMNDLILREDVERVVCEDDSTPAGIYNEYLFSVPQFEKGDTYLAFYTVHQYVEVYFQNECVYTLKPSDDSSITKTVGSNWVMIPVSTSDIGKAVRVIITPAYESFKNRQVDFMFGSGLDIYTDRLKKDLPQLIISGLALFVGVVFICVAGYNMWKKHRGKGLLYLGMFSSMLGVWRMTDTRFTPFIFPQYSVLMFYISVTMLIIGMVPIMKWVEEYYSEKSRKFLDLYCVLSVCISLIQLTLQICGILDLRQMLTVTHVMIAIGVLLIIVIGIYERRVCSHNHKRLIGKQMAYVCVCGVIADVIAYYVKGNSSGLLFTLLAFILYIVFMGISTLSNYGEQEILLAKQDRQLVEQERQLVEQEKHLTDSRIKAMMSQIRSHFIFNVLTTISTYCKIDPKTADAALIRFSRYLRKNIKIIEEDGLIDFDMELEQVEDYVALEQLRFPDSINFDEEISTSSFQIPPLTIQPLVENAIKHGLVENGKSGTIMLKTIREMDCIKIVVEDDGGGFDVEQKRSKESVGIRNVRYRIENMVGGSLTIESSVGCGTIATVCIPIKETIQHEYNLCR